MRTRPEREVEWSLGHIPWQPTGVESFTRRLEASSAARYGSVDAANFEAFSAAIAKARDSLSAWSAVNWK